MLEGRHSKVIFQRMEKTVAVEEQQRGGGGRGTAHPDPLAECFVSFLEACSGSSSLLPTVLPSVAVYYAMDQWLIFRAETTQAAPFSARSTFSKEGGERGTSTFCNHRGFFNF